MVGRERADGPYVWPRTLLVPTRPPKVVYLDLNHWISLAKPHAGHRLGGEYRASLDACLSAAQSGRAVFPISDSIFFEVAKIGRHRQRLDLQRVIEDLSGYVVITARNIISAHEVEAMLDARVGPNPSPINFMNYLDWGVMRAFGYDGRLRIYDKEHKDVTAEVRAAFRDGPEAFDERVVDIHLKLQRASLAGPTPGAEEEELRKLGYDTSKTIAVGHMRAAQEIEQVRRFTANPEWRRGRIRDVVAAREVLIEIKETLDRGISERGATLEDVFETPEAARTAFDAMPSFDVAVSIKTSYHLDPMHRWTSNDIHDIDALGSAVPYCDIVLTDKAVASQLQRTGVDERLHTTVLHRLADLLPLL